MRAARLLVVSLAIVCPACGAAGNPPALTNDAGAGSSEGGGTVDGGSPESGPDAAEAGADGASSGTPLSVTLSTAAVVNTLGPRFLGINYVAHHAPPSNEDWPASTSSQGIAQTAIQALRFPGGDPADLFDWRCPYYDPTSSTVCPSAPTATSWNETNPGTDLWGYIAPFKTASTVVLYQTDVFGDTGWTYGANTLSLPVPAGYTTKATDPATVQAWAQAVQSAGYAADWEIGNEPELVLAAQNPPQAFSLYTTAFNAQASAIHAAASGAHVFGPAISAHGFPTATSDGALGEFFTTGLDASQLYGVSIHHYTDGLCQPAAATWTALAAIPAGWASGPMAYVKRVLAKHSFTGPIAVTEFALGPQGCTSSGDLQRPQYNPMLGNALVNLDMIGALATSGASQAFYFDIHNGNDGQYADGLFYHTGEPTYPPGRGADSPTALFYAFVMWKAMGDQVVTCNGDPSVSTSEVECWATTRSGDGSVQALVVNKTGSPHTLAVSGFGAHSSVTRYSLTSSSVTPDWTDIDVAYNGTVNPPYTSALPAPATDPVSGSSYSTSLPAYSAIILSFGG